MLEDLATELLRIQELSTNQDEDYISICWLRSVSTGKRNFFDIFILFTAIFFVVYLHFFIIGNCRLEYAFAPKALQR